MFAHGLVAFYVSVYLIEKYKTFQSQALFSEFVITVVIVAGICSALAVVGIWSKDNVKSTSSLMRIRSSRYISGIMWL